MAPKPEPEREDFPGASAGYRPGDLADFDRLYAATYQRIFRTLVTVLGDRAAAEDCTQDTFLRAFRAWPRWKQDAPVEAWLHRIAINTAISHRRRQRLRELPELLRRLGRPEEVHPEDEALAGDVLKEIRRLPPRQAAAIVLRHLHGYSNREIGAALGVPESTVATRLMDAKRTLRRRLAGGPENFPDTPGRLRVPPYE